ncbi:hypothetical protein NtRootA1_48470 [Arthrobacter sp. NtRootA1]|nr:hypothetical protein NtRootA1_48470 [Arthrobacter sp. NtRootA1]
MHVRSAACTACVGLWMGTVQAMHNRTTAPPIFSFAYCQLTEEHSSLVSAGEIYAYRYKTVYPTWGKAAKGA